MTRFGRPRFLFLFLFLTLVCYSGCVPSTKKRDRALSSVKIVLDPGHGGKDGGASFKGRMPEKQIVLHIALQVERLLKEKNLRVVMTRRSDQFVPLSRRAKIANDHEAALFASIHANSSSRQNVKGFEIYHAGNRWQKESLKAALLVQRSLKSASHARDRGIKSYNFTALSQAKCPSLLVEVGYLSNPDEAKLLSSPSYRGKVAAGIADGIIAYARTRR